MSCAARGSKLLLVGNQDPIHVGAHLSSSARELSCAVTFCDATAAFEGNALARNVSWRLQGHRPNRLHDFSDSLVATCRDRHPQFMLSTGIAPVDKAALREIGRMGTIRLNYLTDDPWNPAHVAGWFLDALRHYDWIFSTRRSNLNDLIKHGCTRVMYLPFAYAPDVHFSDPPTFPEDQARFVADVAFAGGADRDRVPLLALLIRSGFEVALYGGYWDRYAETRSAARGHANLTTVRRALGGAKVTLCLVRRANRDGSAMRTFEAAAMGACMLAEYTDEHRELLGEDGDAVVYFSTPEQMVDRLRWLLAHDDERRRLAETVRCRITGGRNTYKDRLEAMLAAAGTTVT